ncbi:metallopeptidase TldD-related protein [Cupriavidus basilensis]
MQRDDWYFVQARLRRPAAPEDIYGSPIKPPNALSSWPAFDPSRSQFTTRRCPVLVQALAAGLLGAFVQAVSGVASPYRKPTFLHRHAGCKAVFAPHIHIPRTAPSAGRHAAGAPFDEEGVKTHARDVVRAGVVSAISSPPTRPARRAKPSAMPAARIT